MLLGWRAWYADGRTFRGEVRDGLFLGWHEMPAEGLVYLVAYHDTGRTMYHGDWTWIADGEIRYTPPTAPGVPWSDRPPLPCTSCLKRGALVSDAEFARISAEAFVI